MRPHTFWNRLLELASAWKQAQTLLQMEEWVHALAALNSLIEGYPEFGRAWGERGLLMNRLGRFQDALSSLEDARRLNRCTVQRQ